MSGRRKDREGRVLKDGESQRSNGTYMYRYLSFTGERKTLYAKTLEELRKKEDAATKNRLDSISDDGNKITVYELYCTLIDLKRNLKPSTMYHIGAIKKKIKESKIGNTPVSKVKPIHAKAWLVELSDEGYAFGTIDRWRCALKATFQLAIDNDLIRKNPINFPLSNVITDTTEKRSALTLRQEQQYFDCLEKYGNPNFALEIKILLETGLRVSELYGLTKSDVDFKENCIFINKNLIRNNKGGVYVSTPKTPSSRRIIPLTDKGVALFREAVDRASCRRVEPMIDGCVGFLFLSERGNPKTAIRIESYMRRFMQKVRELCGNNFPTVTPHVLRHTFCTRAVEGGMNIKSLQYIMGHSTATMTLDVYSHSSYDAVKKDFLSALG